MQEIEAYNVTADNVKVDVKIKGTKDRALFYHIVAPTFGVATMALLDEIRSELITEVRITTAEILDPKVIDELKLKFRKKAESLLKEKIPKIDDRTVNLLIGTLLHEMLGLGKIEFLLNDPYLEEIVVTSSKECIRIYHKKYGWLETDVCLKSEEQIQNYANIMARRVGRQITTLSPLLDAHLLTGDRSNAVLYPVSTKGNTITIRKFAREPWTVIDFIKNKTCPSNIFALLWLAIQYEMNVLISGGTASGKTSLLNTLMQFIPFYHRVISIEDTREIQLAKNLYWCPLTTRQPNPEGKGQITELDLLINSLRMRPDRIILGEIRRKEQAETLFEAMHTGHSVYSTVHADSLAETIKRLINPPIGIPANLLSAVNLNVVMFRDRRKGIRRVYQIGEYIPTEEDIGIKQNLLYRWTPEKDVMVMHTEPVRFYEELSRYTGMSLKEINDDLKEKHLILNWMIKKNIRSINDFGKIMTGYYLDPEDVLKKIKRMEK